MSVFDPIDPKIKEKEQKKPTIEEVYGYEEGEMPEEEEENMNFLDKMINDLKQKEQKAMVQQKEVTGGQPTGG